MAYRAITPDDFAWITQTVNHGDEDLLVYAYGTPPDSESAEILDSAV